LDKKPAVFVDRDDTIITDVGYCDDPNEVHLLAGAAEGLRLLSRAGYFVVIVTNQSGLGRGYFDEQQLNVVNERLREELRSRGADFDALYYCPHLPQDNCSCRKPRPGLLLRAASELNLDLNLSYTIGDNERDIEAGREAGTRTVLVRAGEGSDKKFGAVRSPADIEATSIEDAARIILGQNPVGR
jgi:histidinol-phosphate phosphatase family protein